ncbi:variable large family protein, partial [Borreliella garinii]|uniref:variable large family protein n=1 Tax=Borreliella garinii TaxID=29519 RepID=UPI001AEF97A1
GEWLDGLIKAAESGGKAAESGGGESIGNVDAARGGGANADAAAVKGIASAMKGIVEAAGKVEGVKFKPAAAADASGADGNKKAGKLFGTNAGAAADKEKVKAVVEWLDGLIKAAESGGKAAADGGADKIGNVAAAAGGAGADANAVKGIAGAMKGIVEAARKVEGVKFEPAAAAAAGGNGNKKAGKLFGTNAGADDAKEAAAAVGAVSGEQILSAIV